MTQEHKGFFGVSSFEPVQAFVGYQVCRISLAFFPYGAMRAGFDKFGVKIRALIPHDAVVVKARWYAVEVPFSNDCGLISRVL